MEIGGQAVRRAKTSGCVKIHQTQVPAGKLCLLRHALPRLALSKPDLTLLIHIHDH